MGIDEVLITALPGDRRAAALAGGQLLRLALAGDDEIRVGDIILGRINTVAASIGGAFVDLGRGPHGLLMRDDATGGQRLAEGEAILCQVLREAIGEKGPKLTARLPALPDKVRASLPDARAPSRLARGPDPVFGLLGDALAAGVARVVVDDGAELSRIRGALPGLADKLEAWLEPAPLFAAFGVDEAIDRALAPIVTLPSGGRLTIEETEALVVIDVDAGATSGGSPKTAALACDVEAAAAIGREIVIRDLTGIIIIDFVPLRRRAERERVLAELRSSLAGDDRQIRIAGWTRLGLVEVSRERRRPSLVGRLTADCAACAGQGRAISPRWAAGNALRALLAEACRDPAATPSLTVEPAIFAQLRGPLAQALAKVEDKLGARVALVEAYGSPAKDLGVLQPGAGLERAG